MLPSAINRPACPSFGRPVSIAKPITANPKSPVPPAGEAEMQSISGSGVIDPSGSPEGSALWRAPPRRKLCGGSAPSVM